MKLYLERLSVAEKIAETKLASGKPVYDPERERKVLYRLSERAPEDKKLYVKELYETIFSTSKAYQSKFTEKCSGVSEKLRSIIDKGLPDFPVSGTAACQGMYGANSGAAAEKIFAIPGIGYYFVNSVTQRDYTTIMGVTIFFAAFLMAMVLLVDIFYCLIDPRIKFDA